MQSNLTVIHLFTIEWSLFSLWKKAASKPWAEIALEEEKRDKCLSWEGEHNHHAESYYKQTNKQKKTHQSSHCGNMSHWLEAGSDWTSVYSSYKWGHVAYIRSFTIRMNWTWFIQKTAWIGNVLFVEYSPTLKLQRANCWLILKLKAQLHVSECSKAIWSSTESLPRQIRGLYFRNKSFQ